MEVKGWKPDEAYAFCSLACDLHVTQLVDGITGIHAMVRRDLPSYSGACSHAATTCTGLPRGSSIRTGRKA